MLNRPFSSTNFNVYDEKTQNTTPAHIGGHNVLVSQEQHQKVFNTLTTSIAGASGYPHPGLHYNPNAVTFTFPPQYGGYAHPNHGYPQGYQPYQQPPPYWQCQSPALQNMHQMHQSNVPDLLQLQRHLNQFQPCQWRFHLDGQTSTSDLGAKTNARADLSNLAGVLNSKVPLWLRTPTSRDHKKLILKNVTAKADRSMCDELEHEEDRKKCHVSFSLEDKKDADVQVCTCCSEEKDQKKKVKKKGKSSRSKSPAGSDSNPNLHKESPKSRDRLDQDD